MGFLPVSDVEEGPMVTPFVTIGLIAVNVLVFFLVQPPLSEEFLDTFYRQYAVVPALVAQGQNLLSVLTAMFLHGGIAHLGSNMLYLWIFGDNVEHALGHLRYLVFYLACGLAATAAQVLLFSGSEVPNLGASGAIAGVLGAYLVMFPRAQINVIMGRTGMGRLSALMVIGLWFVLQLLSGGSQILAAGEGGGVAYWAHIGGFVVGAGIAWALGARDRGPAMASRA